MKQFKILDTCISILLIISCAIWVFNTPDNLLTAVTWSYSIVGGWQLLSMIIHAINGWFTNKNSKRQHYHIIVLSTIIFTLISIIPNAMIVPLYILIYTAPVMAIYYTYICYHEINIKMKRPLDQLK